MLYQFVLNLFLFRYIPLCLMHEKRIKNRYDHNTFVTVFANNSLSSMFSHYFLEWSNCVSVICVYVLMRMHDHRMFDEAFEYFNVYVVWSFRYSNFNGSKKPFKLHQRKNRKKIPPIYDHSFRIVTTCNSSYFK